MKDLWAFDKLTKDDSKDTPHGILREQSEIFEKKTKGTLFIKLSTRKIYPKVNEKFGLATNFDIIAPVLDGYSYTLFTLYTMPERDYPVGIDTEVDKDIFNDSDLVNINENEEEFIVSLKLILSSSDTTQIVKNLYSKSFE